MARFTPGKSGNPAGRKPGGKDKRTELRELLKPHAAALIEKAVSMALKGDPSALRLCIDRLMPPLRPQREAVTLKTSGSLDEQASQIFEAATAGAIGADVAAELVGVLASQVRILETAELLERLEVLENKLAVLLERDK